jgi:hypothetical protein
MSEADWWLCGHCQSLNNLSARKCYSCRKRKPRDAVRASERLGYVPVFSESGKVSLVPITPTVAAQPEEDVARPAPLRDPVQRDTLAVAPRPPHGARITYQPEATPPPPPPGGHWPAAGLPPSIGVGPGLVPGLGGEPTGVPVAATADHVQWPHWRDLLDGPTPEGERLRAAYETDGDAVPGVEAPAGQQRSSALSQAIKRARDDTPIGSRSSIPWPPADRAMPDPDASGDSSEHDSSGSLRVEPTT